MQVDSLAGHGIFLLESTFGADSPMVSVKPHVLSHAFIFVYMLNIPTPVSPVWWIMETLKCPACTVGWAAPLSQLAFPKGRQPKIPKGEIRLGQHSCKIVNILCPKRWLERWMNIVEKDNQKDEEDRVE